ncbi:CHRD domain-containing protein [Hyalangium gracile]|uniref:CHRD domain-containing protein n=1 Tax=Hyalangium gracile TaxID=394092 RepID=UPI001CCA97D1|nr:CHRD domain-containing protein [Hyalangium gracile]
MACGRETELAALLSPEAVRPRELTASLSGAAQRPNPVQTAGSGSVVSWVEGTRLIVQGSFRGLSANATAAHFHGLADENSTAPVFCSLRVPIAATGAIASGTEVGSCGTMELTAADVANLQGGKLYVNIHTTLHAGGELRGQLRPRPPSEGWGSALLKLDGKRLDIFGSFEGLESNAVSAQIRGPADESSTGPVFCSLQVPTSRSGAFELGQGTDSCGDRALSTSEVEQFKSGGMYILLNTETRPNGELRGQIFLGNLDD